MAKPKIKRIILLLVLVAAITGGILFYGDSGQGLKNDLLIYGNVDIRQVRLAFHDTGRIMTLYVTEGDPVSAGTGFGLSGGAVVFMERRITRIDAEYLLS